MRQLTNQPKLAYVAMIRFDEGKQRGRCDSTIGEEPWLEGLVPWSKGPEAQLVTNGSLVPANIMMSIGSSNISSTSRFNSGLCSNYNAAGAIIADSITFLSFSVNELSAPNGLLNDWQSSPHYLVRMVPGDR